MGSSKNLHVFNFTILLQSQKFDVCEIYIFTAFVVDAVIVGTNETECVVEIDFINDWAVLVYIA